MKRMALSFYLFFIALCNLATAQNIRIISDFETASIGSLKQVSPNKFRGQTNHWIKFDQVGDQYHWFYFQVVNVNNKTVQFELDNLIGKYRGYPSLMFTDYTQPVLSYDNKNWERIKDVTYHAETKSFCFNVHFNHDTAWVAYTYPYTYTRSANFVESIIKSPFAVLNAKGISPEGRTVPLIEITDRSSTKEKKKIFIMTMQHPGEYAGGFVTEGIINFLLSGSSEAERLRKKFVYYIIPLMNPDGAYHGITRYSPKMQDFNDEWIRDKAELFGTPSEVNFVKQWVASQYKKNQKMDLFIDIHCPTQSTRSIYLMDGTETELLRDLVESIDNRWYTAYKPGRDYERKTSANFFFNVYNIPSGTLEVSQSCLSGGNGDYLNIGDYWLYGEDLVKAITKYFDKN